MPLIPFINESPVAQDNLLPSSVVSEIESAEPENTLGGDQASFLNRTDY
jgi:hypothetical protein